MTMAERLQEGVQQAAERQAAQLQAVFSQTPQNQQAAAQQKATPAQLRKLAAHHKAAQARHGAAQRVGLCGTSEALLMAALTTMPGMPSEEAHLAQDDRPRHGWDSSRHVVRPATVPARARGNAALLPMRMALPVWEHRMDILKTIADHRVVIIEGETGCGKTTQVAQYIVDHAAEYALPCSVVCTQPRRISAISVAERVASERGEQLGTSVGYSVRLESRQGASTSLLFCTTGILLRRMEEDSELLGTTHVVVDEVHERGVESDFLLLALRDLCCRRADLKVILMSATMDKDLFGRYFGGAPALTVPGRTFPVETYFLEHALQATRHTLNPSAEWAIGGARPKGKGKGVDTSDRESLDAPKREDLTPLTIQTRYGSFNDNVQTTLARLEQDAVNYELLVQLLVGSTLPSFGKDGACEGRPSGVLVFMSGAKEIEQVQELLWQTPEFCMPPARNWVLPLHGSLPTEDQKRVFERPPAGVRKIVIATNVAETAITINDIGYVVDTCRMKEMRYDPIRCMSSLEDTVVSRTNARQRRGRAGRVAPGLCVHIGLTKYRHDTLVDDHQPPEVQRTSLEHLILRIHAARLHEHDPSGKAAAICARLLEPPNPLYVAKAVEQLVRLGALIVEPGTGRERLTALGSHLARLPLEARLGKLVLYGTAFGPAATDAALTVAAALTSRNPFLAPMECREEAAAAKKRFAEKMVTGCVGVSDHLAVLAAYQEWDKMPWLGSMRYDFCRSNYLSTKTLQGMADLKRGLLETLSDCGFVQKNLKAKEVGWFGRSRDHSDGVLLVLAQGEPCEPCSPPLIAALLCAALFPQVATASQSCLPKKLKQGASTDGLPKPRLMVRDAETGEPVKVKMHPGSVAWTEVLLSSPYLVYQDLVQSSSLYVRDVTPVPPLALALFSGSLAEGMVYPDGHAELIVDGWIRLAIPTRARRPLLETRRRLDALLASWVGRPDSRGSGQHAAGAELLRVIVQLLNIQEECAPGAGGDHAWNQARQVQVQKQNGSSAAPTAGSKKKKKAAAPAASAAELKALLKRSHKIAFGGSR